MQNDPPPNNCWRFYEAKLLVLYCDNQRLVPRHVERHKARAYRWAEVRLCGKRDVHLLS